MSLNAVKGAASTLSPKLRELMRVVQASTTFSSDGIRVRLVRRTTHPELRD